MKEIKSKVQPNHRECQIWIDLSEDPHGSVKKHWNGEKWVKTADDNIEKVQVEIKEIRELIASLFKRLADLESLIGTIKEYDDTKLHERINKLISRVNKLEQFIVTE